jgi:hypothetical protein
VVFWINALKIPQVYLATQYLLVESPAEVRIEKPAVIDGFTNHFANEAEVAEMVAVDP